MHVWSGMSHPTLVGSMPHKDPEKAIELILQAVPTIPAWPQLAAFRAEQMMVQYLEGLPGVDCRSDRILVGLHEPQFDDEVLRFYEEYLEVEAGTRELESSRFAMGPDSGRTFYRFLEVLSTRAQECFAVKGQVVGPFTLLAGLKDEGDRLALYDEKMQDVVAKHLAMKARWQVRQLKRLDCPVILFLDEPALAGFGSSAFISVSRELVDGVLREVIDAVHMEGGLAGIHVCANTEWMIAFQSGVDIINFDAYSYFDRFSLYGEALAQFVGKGGNIAWGLVPTGDHDRIREETAGHLVDQWLENVKTITTPSMTVDRLLRQSLFTPSCGCGSLPEALAERVLHLTREVGAIMQGHLHS